MTQPKEQNVNDRDDEHSDGNTVPSKFPELIAEQRQFAQLIGRLLAKLWQVEQQENKETPK